MEDKDLDKLFRDTFIDAQENPRDGIWQKIENTLEEQPKAAPISRIKYWPALSAAAILVITLGYWGIKQSNKQETPEIAEKKVLLSNANIDKQEVVKQNSNIAPQKDESIKLQKEDLDKELQVATTNEMPAKPAKEHNIQNTNIEVIEATKATRLTVNNPTLELPTVRQVTEIDDIQPLIEPEEEMETMLASAEPKVRENRNIITSVLNTISENIDTKKEVRFYADEEGSFGINIINSIAKNRNKKRK